MGVFTFGALSIERNPNFFQRKSASGFLTPRRRSLTLATKQKISKHFNLRAPKIFFN